MGDEPSIHEDPRKEETFLLLVGAKEGNRENLEEYMTRVRPRLEAWIALRLGSFLRSRLDVEDVVQETMLHVYTSLPNFAPAGARASLRWVFQIAENRIREAHARLRAAKRDPARERELSSRLEASWTSASLAAVRREEHELLLFSFRELSEEHRDVIRLIKIEGLSYEEAGSELSITAKNAGVRLVRAVKAWRKKREELGPAPSWS